MSQFSTLLAISAASSFIVAILFIIFGQVTVRKLRKMTETKDMLGLEFINGWDIINVAQALSLPRSLTKILDQSSLSFLHANSELLHKNTNWFDRILAKTFYWLFLLTGLSLILLVSLNGLGFFD